MMSAGCGGSGPWPSCAPAASLEGRCCSAGADSTSCVGWLFALQMQCEALREPRKLEEGPRQWHCVHGGVWPSHSADRHASEAACTAGAVIYSRSICRLCATHGHLSGRDGTDSCDSCCWYSMGEAEEERMQRPSRPSATSDSTSVALCVRPAMPALCADVAMILRQVRDPSIGAIVNPLASDIVTSHGVITVLASNAAHSASTVN